MKINVRESREVFNALYLYGWSPFICQANWKKSDLWKVLMAYRKKAPVFNREFKGREYSRLHASFSCKLF